MMRDFSAGISKLRYELAKNLAEADVLKSEKLENVTSVFNKRLTVFQHDFLNLIAQTKGTAPNRTTDPNLKAKGRSHIPEAIGAIGGAAAGYTAGGVVVSTTAAHGMWWWAVGAHTVTVATYVAGAVGTTAAVATGGLAAVGGVAVAIAANKGTSKWMRKRIRKGILADFDKKVVPQLTTWAESILNE